MHVIFLHVAAFFEYLPKRTINQRGAKTVWVRCGGKSKERATVMFLGDSDGRKYSPFVVFKTQRSTVQGRHEENLRERNGFGKAIWRELELLPHDLRVHGNAKGVFICILRLSDAFVCLSIFCDYYPMILRTLCYSYRLVECLPLDRVSSVSFWQAC